MSAQTSIETVSPLGALCSAQSISCGQLAKLASVGRTSAFRLMRDTGTAAGRKQAVETLVRTLPNFLAVERGLSDAEIDKLLSETFPEEYQPMISQRIELTATELAHFRLSADPFKLPPQSRDEVFVFE